jgi:hypothetical protein
MGPNGSLMSILNFIKAPSALLVLCHVWSSSRTAFENDIRQFGCPSNLLQPDFWTRRPAGRLAPGESQTFDFLVQSGEAVSPLFLMGNVVLKGQA